MPICCDYETDKLCFIDKTAIDKTDRKLFGSPLQYNKKVKKAITALNRQLPSFVVIDEGIKDNERLCLLIERGSFWGMGYLPAGIPVTTTDALKNYLVPYADNDFIRNSIYSYVDAYPHKKLNL